MVVIGGGVYDDRRCRSSRPAVESAEICFAIAACTPPCAPHTTASVPRTSHARRAEQANLRTKQNRPASGLQTAHARLRTDPRTRLGTRQHRRPPPAQPKQICGGADCWQRQACNLDGDVSPAILRGGRGFKVSGFGFRVSGFRFWDSGFGFPGGPALDLRVVDSAQPASIYMSTCPV
jgi:hypothetical protein